MQRLVLVATTIVALLMVSVNGQEQTTPPRAHRTRFPFSARRRADHRTATVTDQTGGSFRGCARKTFVTIQPAGRRDAFQRERVPVSLSIVLDRAQHGNRKIREALAALDRSYDL
jgi:hypothetical protein